MQLKLQDSLCLNTTLFINTESGFEACVHWNRWGPRHLRQNTSQIQILLHFGKSKKARCVCVAVQLQIIRDLLKKDYIAILERAAVLRKTKIEFSWM